MFWNEKHLMFQCLHQQWWTMKKYALEDFIKYFSQGMELHIKGPKQVKWLDEL